ARGISFVALFPPGDAIARTTAWSAVVRATRRLNRFSRRSSSSSGFGSSSSGTRRRRALADFLAHRVLAGLEGAQEALGLLLEKLPALVQPLPRAPPRLGRLASGPRRPPAA